MVAIALKTHFFANLADLSNFSQDLKKLLLRSTDGESTEDAAHQASRKNSDGIPRTESTPGKLCLGNSCVELKLPGSYLQLILLPLNILP